jgi:arsenate reductase (thioredoxin)
MEPVYNILFLSERNAARSLIAEAVMNRLSSGRIRAYSAGTNPAAEAHPGTAELLDRMSYPRGDLRPRHVDEVRSRVPIDLVIGIRDSDSAGAHPVETEQTAIWEIEDPSAAPPAQREEAFATALRYLTNRISLLLALPVASLEAMRARTLERADG